MSFSLGYNLFDAVRINWFGSFRAGNPYTPLVSGDVNGDGYSNDRAFIFDPATAADPTVATAMTSLLETTDREARAWDEMGADNTGASIPFSRARWATSGRFFPPS